jgi:hypothetical protein
MEDRVTSMFLVGQGDRQGSLGGQGVPQAIRPPSVSDRVTDTFSLEDKVSPKLTPSVEAKVSSTDRSNLVGQGVPQD